MAKNPHSSTAVLTIRADRVTEVSPGVHRIEIKCTPIARQDAETLARLFPKLGEAAYRLLNQELLMDALLTEDEATVLSEPPY